MAPSAGAVLLSGILLDRGRHARKSVLDSCAARNPGECMAAPSQPCMQAQHALGMCITYPNKPWIH